MERNSLSPNQKAVLATYGLQGLDPELLSFVTYGKAEEVQPLGDPFVRLLILLKGNAKVFGAKPSGLPFLIAQYYKKGVIGEIEFLAKRKTAYGIYAASSLEAIEIPLKTCLPVLLASDEFLSLCGKSVAVRLERAVRGITVNLSSDAKSRVCSYLASENVNGLFNERLTEVAEALGISYRHLLKVFQELCQSGVLRKSESGYAIVSRRKLDRYVVDRNLNFEIPLSMKSDIKN